MPDPTDPASYFREIAAAHDRCFWLDGGGARAWSGRRSIMGALGAEDVSLSYDAASGEVARHVAGTVEVVGSDPFAVLEAELASGDAEDQWFGYFGYASRSDLPARPDSAPGGAGLPDAVWMRCRDVRLFDHPASDAAPGELRLGTEPQRSGRDHVGCGPDRNGEERPEEPPAEYAAAFGQVREELHAGNSYEVNLTYRLAVEDPTDPVSAYLRLRELNPAPYAGFLQHDVPGARAWLLSSSPERYALVTEDRRLETKPIKGTTRRSQDAVEDAAAAAHLARDPKFRAENLMIVDLLRNDLSTVCRPGTVEVPTLMEVESYRSVHQLVSTVTGDLADGVSTMAALRALFPAGSMTGAPKRRTMEIVDAVEATPRGAYSGAFGWIAADGRADLGVVIRSLMTPGDGRWVLGTGGGVIVRSELAEEYAESRWKAERLLRALGRG